MEQGKEQKSLEPHPVKKSLWTRLFKVLFWIVFSIIGLNILLYALLSIPSVQQKVLNIALKELNSKLKTEVSISEIHLSLFNHATLKNIYIEDQVKDTLLYAKYLDVQLAPWQLLKNNKLEITDITLDDFVLKVNKADSLSKFNFDFIIDAFSSTDSLQKDTTKSSLIIQIKNITIRNGQLQYDIMSNPVTPNIFNVSHIHLRDLNGNIDLNSIDMDKLDIAVQHLAAKEHSGLEIKELKGQLYSEKSQLRVNDLFISLPNSEIKANNVQYNLNSNEFAVSTDKSLINPKDLVAFLPTLKYLKKDISLIANINGILPMINADNIDLTYGNDCQLKAKGNISDYNNYGSAKIDVSIEKFKASASNSDITDFARLGDSLFVLPDIAKKLEYINLKGRLNGTFSNFKLNAEAWAKQGAIAVLATGSTNSVFEKFDIVTNVRTQNFALGKLLDPNLEIGNLTTHLNIRLNQKRQNTLIIEAKGVVDALEYKKEIFRNIPLEAYYNPDKIGIITKVELPIGSIAADVSMTQEKVPDVNMHLKVGALKLEHFYKNENWINPRLSFVLDANIKGLDIDNMLGSFKLDSLDLRTDNYRLRPGTVTVDLAKDEVRGKSITFSSSIVSGNINGHYTFASIGSEIENMMHAYLPDLFTNPQKIKVAKNNFEFHFKIQDTRQLGAMFALPVNNILPATIDGQINTINRKISLNGQFPHLMFNDFDIKNINIDLANKDSIIYGIGKASAFINGDIYDLSLNTEGLNNALHSSININSDSAAINLNGKIEAITQFSRNDKKELVFTFQLMPSDIMLDKLKLSFLPAQIINEGKLIEVRNLDITVNDKKYFELDGVISDQKSDSLKATFNHADIGVLLDAFDVKNVHASLNGNLLVTNVMVQPEMYTQGFEIRDIIIFKDTLGTMNVESQWNEEFGGIKINALLNKEKQNYAEIDGIVYTNQDYLDLQVRLEKFPIDWTQPFAAGMLNKVAGSISTNIMIEGSIKEPKVRGFLGFNNTQIGIDYTNVVYTVSDTIRISPDKIGFENLLLKDSYGNTAQVNASATHDNYKKMRYSLNMQMNKLMVLNTENRTDSLFYGKVFASGTVRVNGDDEEIGINMQVKNEKNSVLNILIPQRTQASEYQSIVYINVPKEKLDTLSIGLNQVKNDILPLKLNVKLNVTPDLLLKVVIDPITGDEMQATGNGDINFSYDMRAQNMAAYGEYDLENGHVKLNLQRVKKLNFEIQEGSKLQFLGDPQKAKFDITAFRKVKADLKSLDNSFVDDKYSSKITVNCVLGIKGNLEKMDLDYNIDLLDANDDIKRKVNSIINTEEQKIRQFASLVALNKFFSTGSSGAGITEGLWTNLAADALSSGLNGLLDNVLGEKWQIGTNIESNDGTLSNVGFSVNVSTKIFDDKLKLNTNLGYRGQSSTSDNSFIGDFDVEYELSRLWTLKAYNHTNDKYYKQAPTTQGIGIVYTKEAATLKRLFQSFKPRRRNRLNTVGSNPQDSIKTKETPKQPEIIEEKKKK